MIKVISTVLVVLLLGVSGCGKSDSWPNLGVIVNNNLIKKDLVAECCFRGKVRKIQVGDFLPGLKQEIAVLAQTGILFLDAESLEEIEKLKFAKDTGDTIWFGLSPHLISSNDSSFTIMQGGNGFGETGLLDRKGNRVWSFKVSASNPHMMKTADLDGDNKAEFYASDYSGLYRLNTSGEIVWKLPKIVTDIALFETKKDNIRGLAALDTKAGVIYLITADGTIYGEIKVKNNVYHFDSVLIDGETLLIVRSSSKSINVVNMQGDVLFSYIFQDIPVYHGPVSTSVKFEGSNDTYIAVLMSSRSSIGKSVISIFSITGILLYQEVLDGGSGMASVAGKLLVGDGSKYVWSYYYKSPNKSLNLTGAKNAPPS